jgi:large subunit ribosomal protein L24
MINAEQVKLSIRKNDQVQVIAGREKGKSGKVLKINTKTGRITVEKINMVKRHTKPSQASPQGGILEKELPLDYSNVLLMCAKCDRGVRHAKKIVGDKKVRVCKKCGTSLEAAKV